MRKRSGLSFVNAGPEIYSQSAYRGSATLMGFHGHVSAMQFHATVFAGCGQRYASTKPETNRATIEDAFRKLYKDLVVHVETRMMTSWLFFFFLRFEAKINITFANAGRKVRKRKIHHKSPKSVTS